MHDANATPATDRRFLALCLAASGVVFGDIGTSPLYTWNELVETGSVASPDQVLGVCSLLFWTLTLAISVKYVGLVLLADNAGEGGTFALMGLVRQHPFRGRSLLLGLLVFAACLLYAEGLMTPAISVLSAIEGLAVASPALHPVVVPMALAVLVLLFWFQYLGTARLGTAFGVVATTWFLAIGGIGFAEIVQRPDVLLALSPHFAVRFLLTHSLHQIITVLGAVVLAITGGEALYADLGHFGRRAVRTTWGMLVYPALILNYFGQAAWLIDGKPVVQGNVFFSIVPHVLLYPMIALATAAAITASQALISGAFSLTRAAMHLGLVPRLVVLHTSELMEGQIYMPAVNAALCVGCCALVVGFGSSSNLAAAYGIAVMGVMVVTTLSLAAIAVHRWGWKPRLAIPVFAGLLLFDGSFLGANVVKIPEGAWFSLTIAASLYMLMATWRSGRAELAEAWLKVPRVPVSAISEARPRLAEMPRAMVFLVSHPILSAGDPAPLLLLRFIDLYGALPRHVTLFTVVPEPSVPRWTAKRFEVIECGERLTAVRMHLGYLEQPDVRAALIALKLRKLIKIHATRWTIVVGRDEVVLGPGPGLWKIRAGLFRLMVWTSSRVVHWFGLERDTGISEQTIAAKATADGMEVAITVRDELLAGRPIAQAPVPGEAGIP
jgi:KUP system potassium uptake protein